MTDTIDTPSHRSRWEPANEQTADLSNATMLSGKSTTPRITVPPDTDLVRDDETGILYELSNYEFDHYAVTGELPADIHDLMLTHRAEHTIDLANEATRRLDQIETNRKVARWASGEDVR